MAAKTTFATGGDDFKRFMQLVGVAGAGVVIWKVISGRKVKPVEGAMALLTILSFFLDG